jgi:hypothetical protein
MKYLLLNVIAVVSVVTVAALNFPNAAYPVVTPVGQFQGQSASAFFWDGLGCDCMANPTCINTIVDVFAFDFKDLTPPSMGVPSLYTTIQIFQFDTCGDGTSYMDAYCSSDLASQDFQVNKTLNSATLNATVTCYDYSSDPNTYDVSINLTWTATGSPVRTNYHTHNSYPDCIQNFRFSGVCRSAGVSGTVMRDSTNFIASPPLEASICSSNEGGGTICQ